jgi:hypothetical protein
MQPNGIDAGGFQAHNRAMPAGFELKGKVLVADFRANEKFRSFYTTRCDTLTLSGTKTVEGAP